MRITENEWGVVRHVREEGGEALEVGAGAFAELSERRFRILCRKIIRAARAAKIKKIACQFTQEPFPHLRDLSPDIFGALIGEQVEMAHFEWRERKTKPADGWADVEEILLCGNSSKAFKEGFMRGSIIGQGVNACRALSNTPGGDMTPTKLAHAAKEAMRGLPVKVTILRRKELEKLRMGALLGVARGSSEEPTFTILEYDGFRKPVKNGKSGGKGKPIVLAGKGVTFDSGGLSLKTANSMYEMHMDMSGAAAVIHAVALAAKLKLKTRVIGLIPSVENMPGNYAYRPGDILTSLSGKTIEVTNTDAEGRLILADAITYAKRFDPAAVIDVATLTGAAMVALGQHASGILSRDDLLAKQLEESGERSGDYVWRLPLWDEYEELVKGTFADIANASIGAGGRYGGAIEGGMFLWQFAKELDCPWAHIDIAPRMTTVQGEELAKGAAGAGVRLLLRYLNI